MRAGSTQATAQQQSPEVACIRGNDIGWFNIGASHQGGMAGKPPHRDTIVAEGMWFTDDDTETSGIAGLRRHTQRRAGDPLKTTVGLTAVMVLLVTGCATTQRVAVRDQSGICAFLGEVCHELQPGGQREAGLRWVNPKIDLTQYRQVLLEVVGFFGTDASKVPPADQERLTALFQQALTEALATKYPVVDRPAPGTVQLQVAILDAEAATPGLRSVSMVIPQARLLGTGYYAVSGTYPFAGGAQAAFKATDALTGQILGAGVDRQAGGGALQTAAQWQWGDAENAIKAWSRQLADGMYAFTSGARKP